MLRKILCFGLGLVLFAQIAEAETIYVIKQGDTLWGISKKIISDPYYWPHMWSKNPTITNPHIIYPGQKIKIYEDGKIEIFKDSVSNNKKTNIIEGKEKNNSYIVMSTDMVVMEPEEKSGIISSGHNNKTISMENDIVYIEVKNIAQNKKYTIIRETGDLRSVKENKKIGKKYILIGEAKTITENQAEITLAHKEVMKNDILIPQIISRKRNIELKNISSGHSAYIISGSEDRTFLSSGMIVYIDTGNKFISSGNLMEILRKYTVNDTEYEEVVGAALVIDTSDNYSSILIIKNTDYIYPGDMVRFK